MDFLCRSFSSLTVWDGRIPHSFPRNKKKKIKKIEGLPIKKFLNLLLIKKNKIKLNLL